MIRPGLFFVYEIVKGSSLVDVKKKIKMRYIETRWLVC